MPNHDWLWRSPPNWPAPPGGWRPPYGWKPPPEWPPAPPGWSFWESAGTPEWQVERPAVPLVLADGPARTGLVWETRFVMVAFLLPVVMSAVPKSVTTPIAIEVSRELKGIPQITIALVILAGVLGATFGPLLLRLAGVRGDLAIGAAMGTASHGIGTASLVRHSELQASVSSWAMAAAGVCVSLMAALMMLFLR